MSKIGKNSIITICCCLFVSNFLLINNVVNYRKDLETKNYTILDLQDTIRQMDIEINMAYNKIDEINK